MATKKAPATKAKAPAKKPAAAKAPAKKPAAAKPVAAKPAEMKPIKAALNKTTLVAHLAENSGVEPKAVKAVLAALGQVQSELNKAVLARHTADNYSEACGLSVQLPTSSLEKLDKKFMPFSDSAAPPQWKSFVTEMSDKL